MSNTSQTPPNGKEGVVVENDGRKVFYVNTYRGDPNSSPSTGQKPLYHGSFKNIEGDLTPRLSTGDINGDFPCGPQDLVFASSNKNTCMLYALKSSPEHIFSIEHGAINIATGTKYDEWKQALQNSACTLYTLPADTFSNTIRQFDNTSTDEWTSTQAVRPLKAERVTPEDVMRAGGQLIFLQPEIDGEVWSQFTQIILRHIDEGYDPKEFTGVHLLRELQDAGLIQHYLNAEAGINPIEFPKSQLGAALLKDGVTWLRGQTDQRHESALQHDIGMGSVKEYTDPFTLPKLPTPLVRSAKERSII